MEIVPPPIVNQPKSKTLRFDAEPTVIQESEGFQELQQLVNQVNQEPVILRATDLEGPESSHNETLAPQVIMNLDLLPTQAEAELIRLIRYDFLGQPPSQEAPIYFKEEELKQLYCQLSQSRSGKRGFTLPEGARLVYFKRPSCVLAFVFQVLEDEKKLIDEKTGQVLDSLATRTLKYGASFWRPNQIEAADDETTDSEDFEVAEEARFTRKNRRQIRATALSRFQKHPVVITSQVPAWRVQRQADESLEAWKKRQDRNWVKFRKFCRQCVAQNGVRAK